MRTQPQDAGRAVAVGGDRQIRRRGEERLDRPAIGRAAGAIAAPGPAARVGREQHFAQQIEPRIDQIDADRSPVRIAADTVRIRGIAALYERVDHQRGTAHVGLDQIEEHDRPLRIAAPDDPLAALRGAADGDPRLARGIGDEVDGRGGGAEADHAALAIAEHVAAIVAAAAGRLVGEVQQADDVERAVEQFDFVAAPEGIAAIAGAAAIAADPARRPAGERQRRRSAVQHLHLTDPAARIAAGDVAAGIEAAAAFRKDRIHGLAHRDDRSGAVRLDQPLTAECLTADAALDTRSAADAARSDEQHRRKAVGIIGKIGRQGNTAALAGEDFERAAATGAADAIAAIGILADPVGAEDRAAGEHARKGCRHVALDDQLAVRADRAQADRAAGAVAALMHRRCAAAADCRHLCGTERDGAAIERLDEGRAAGAVPGREIHHAAAADTIGEHLRMAGDRDRAGRRGIDRRDIGLAAGGIAARAIAGRAAIGPGIDQRIAVDGDGDPVTLDRGKTAEGIAAVTHEGDAAEAAGHDVDLIGGKGSAKTAEQRRLSAGADARLRALAAITRAHQHGLVRGHVARAHRQEGIAAGAIAAIAAPQNAGIAAAVDRAVEIGVRPVVGDPAIAANAVGFGKHAAEGRRALPERAVLSEQRQPDLRQTAEPVTTVAAEDIGDKAGAAGTAETGGARRGIAADIDRAVVAARENIGATAKVGIGLIGNAELPAIAVTAATGEKRIAIGVAAVAAPALGTGQRIAGNRDARALGERAVGLEIGIAAAAHAAIAASVKARIAAEAVAQGRGTASDSDGADQGVEPGDPAETVAAVKSGAAFALRIGAEHAADRDRAAAEGRARRAPAEADTAGAAIVLAAQTDRIEPQLAGDGDLPRPFDIGRRNPRIADRSGAGIERGATEGIGDDNRIAADVDRAAAVEDVDDRGPGEGVRHARRGEQRAGRTGRAGIELQHPANRGAAALLREELRLPAARGRARQDFARRHAVAARAD